MEREIYRFPEFFSRLKARTALRTRDAVEAETELDGLNYHHRGVQIPAESAVFVWEEEDLPYPQFRLEIGAIGPRSAWAVFDATMSWDVYLILFDGGAAVSWMSDAEFAAEESNRYESKSQAILDGRFSFGTVFLFGPDWIEREEWALRSSAPGVIQLEDGQMIVPETVEEFEGAGEAIPPEFRHESSEAVPSHLGLLDAGLRVDAH